MTKHAKEDEYEEEEVEGTKPYHYYEQLMQRRVHHFYISKEIGDAEGYVDLIHRIKMAGPEEMVYIHLNTPGGCLDTGVQIVNAIQSTQAHVVCSVEAESHSLGTLIFLAADEFIVHDNCMMMFHNWSGGTAYGKGHEQLAQVNAYSEWFTTLARKLYIPFLSEEEFTGIIDGKDLWFQSEEIRDRLKNMVAQMAKDKEPEPEPTKVTKKRAPTKKAKIS